MLNQIGETTKKDNEKYLIEYLRLIIPKLAKKFNINSEDKLHCDYETFKGVLGNFQIPQKYIEDKITSQIFQRFKIKKEEHQNNIGKQSNTNNLNLNNFNNDKSNKKEELNNSNDLKQSENNPELMNYRNFIDYIFESQETNDFFDYKKKIVSNLDQKLGTLAHKISSNKDAYLNTTLANKQNIMKNILNQISENKNLRNSEKLIEDKITTKSDYLHSTFKSQINSTLPSLAQTNKLFSNRKECLTARNEIENSLSANPKFFLKEKAKTRFNGNPPHKNTFVLIAQDKLAPSYVDEHKRFDIRGKWEVDFQVAEKNKKYEVQNKIIERKRKVNQMIMQKVHENENHEEMKDNLTQLMRTQKIYKYEIVTKFLSFFYSCDQLINNYFSMFLCTYFFYLCLLMSV